MNPEIQRELFAIIEKQYGPIEYATMCHSFEDSPEFQRIAGIGLSTQCEVTGCSNISANMCCYCEVAMCQEHSHPTISDAGHDAFACPGCFYG